MTTQQQITVEEMCMKLKPLFGKKIDALYFQYSTSDSFAEKNEIQNILRVLYQKNLKQLLDDAILLEPPKAEFVDGEYPLAKVVYANKELHPFALKEKDWPRHVCVTGMSGSGKTTFAFNILENFIRENKPFLVFDWKKSFRSLINIDNSLLNFTIGNDAIANNFRVNINVPPKGVAPKEWINTLADLLTESFSASFGVHKILLETLDEVFEGWGIYNKDIPKEKKHYPNWQHVKKMLEIKAREAKSRESTWFESALRIASVLTFGSFGKVINYDGKKSLSIEDLMSKRAVFELNSLSNIEKKFFSEYILTYIYKLKKSGQNRINENFNYAILVDEAHNIFLKNKTTFVSEPITDMVYREMREYGISLICLDQHISKLSDTVKGNSACHIAFQQQLPQDIQEISSLAQLKERKDLFSRIPVGQAIVKLSERYTQPFLVNVPFIELRESSISDEKIAQRTNCMLAGVDAEMNDPEFMKELTQKTYSEKPSKTEIGSGVIIGAEGQSEKPSEITQITPAPSEITPTEKEGLTQTQKILYDFICKETEKGCLLKDIEELFEYHLEENCYTIFDIEKSINHFLKEKTSWEKTPNLTEEVSAEIKQPKTEVTVEVETPKKEIVKPKNEKPAVKEIVKPVVKETPKQETKKPEIKIQNADLTEEQSKFVVFLISNPNHEFSTVELYKNMGFSARKGNVLKNALLEKGMIQVQEVKDKHGWKKFIRLSNSNLSNSNSPNKTINKISNTI